MDQHTSHVDPLMAIAAKHSKFNENGDVERLLEAHRFVLQDIRDLGFDLDEMRSAMTARPSTPLTYDETYAAYCGFRALGIDTDDALMVCQAISS